MKKLATVSVLALALILAFGFAAQAGWSYKVKAEHKGGNVTPTKAMQMVKADPKHTFIVDVRTRAEYYFVGHPTMAYHVPSKFLTQDMSCKKGKCGYKLVDNKDFVKDLKARFNPKTDTLIFMCRSGKRSCFGSAKAIAAGFDAKKCFNMLGGFEGDKIKCSESIYNGKRVLGGWKNEGMPWTYTIKDKLAYTPDVPK